MLTLEPLEPSQYRRVAEWEWGPDVDAGAYAELLASPNRLNFGVYQDRKFCASISIEKFGAVARFHVSKEKGAIHPQAMADLLITMADYLFRNGVEELEAAFPRTNRAARRLAIRSWMAPKGFFEEGGIVFQLYAITKEQYYGRTKTTADQNAI